jgi:probable phosphoglycerate mutase
MNSTKICIIRHGETDWNSQRRYQGQIDIGLNAEGEAQARALGAVLAGQRFAKIYASDLQRAWRTAQIAFGDQPGAVLPAPTFRERNYGVFQGLTVPEAHIAHPEAHRHYSVRSLDYNFESGESLRDFAARVMAGFNELVTRHAGETLALVTHGGVLDVIYRVASGRDLSGPRDFAIPNAGINWLRCSDGQWQIDVWGEQAHLLQLDALDELAR